jgi:predicted nucleic acid-binding protein
VERILVDTGFLVALGRARDPCHRAAVKFLESNAMPLVTVAAVVVETCHFLGVDARARMLEWIAADGPAVVDVPPASYPDLASTMERYRERDIDFADAALVWLAEQSGQHAILTVDEGDFSRFRLKGGKRFRLVDWA